MPMFAMLLVFVVLVLVRSSHAQTTVIQCAGVFPLTGRDAREGGVEEALTRKGLERANEIYKATSPRVSALYVLESFDTESSVSGALQAVYSSPLSAAIFTSEDCRVAEAVAPLVSQGGVHYTTCLSQALKQYPNVVEMLPSERHQGDALADLVLHFNWGFTVGVLSSSSDYGAEVLGEFIRRADLVGLDVLSSQQFYPGTQELWQVVSTVKSAQARAIVNIMDVTDMRTVIEFAERLDMLTERYVWLCSDACANEDLFTDPITRKVDEKLRLKFEGMIGIRHQTGHGELYEEFLDMWEKEDPFQFPGAGRRETSFFAPYYYDAAIMYVQAIIDLLVLGQTITWQSIIAAQKNITFEGLTGPVRMINEGHERLAFYDIVNLRSDSLESGFTDFVRIGNCSEVVDLESDRPGNYDAREFDFDFKPQFRFGSFDLPDLDVRNPLEYWSCEDREKKTDETGKSVRLDKPDGKDAKNIDIDYHCDQFLDCYNMSDEWGCDVSFPVVFIVYGIFISVGILLALFCLIFTCVFGFCIKRKRVRAASPTFLIVICLAVIMGYGGLFAFFGQPHTVSCNFRIWFLAVAVITAISALLVKSFRVWRLYRSPTEIKALKDWQLVIFVILSIVPVLILLVLWTGLATPTAMLQEASDNRDHLLCSYGSVAGMAGFYVFFFAIVAYLGLFLLFGVFLSIATRNVVSTFNESRLIAISIYNITFSSIVAIPIVFVLKENEPLITWIVLVTAFMYGFTATLLLQFFPKVWGIVIKDRLAKDPSTQSGGSSGPTHGSVTSKDSKAIF